MEPFAFEKLGANQNPEDIRDFKLGSIQAPVSIPAEYKPKEFFQLTALMQGKQPACGGFSLAQLLQYLYYLRTGNPIALSPRFAYMAEKSLDGIPNVDGTYIRAIGQAATTLGTCLDSLLTDDLTLPFDQYRDFSQASAQAKQDALTRLEPAYFFVDDLSINGIKQAIYQNDAVIIEAKVGSEWWTALDGTITWEATKILPLRPPASVIDSHFFLAGAYDTILLDFINSWSNHWGLNGFGTFAENYAPYIVNAIVIKDVPKSVKQALSTQNINLAQQILKDMEEALNLIKKEI